jgi:hypothetical protein
MAEDVLPPLPDIVAFLESTSRESWWAGPTFRSPCGTRHCVLAHIERRWGAAGMDEFEATYSTSYVIGAAVNDCASDRYPQEHPKGRCVAFLRAMLAGEELTTVESMERCAAQSLTKQRTGGRS